MSHDAIDVLSGIMNEAIDIAPLDLICTRKHKVMYFITHNDSLE